MDTCRPCGCKGCRTCLLCESEYSIGAKSYLSEITKLNSHVYCLFCNKAWPGWDLNEYKTHPNHSGHHLDFPGVYISLNFITEDEENQLLKGIDDMPWDLSQSGRRKQNFGPKCNFKKRKLQLGNFKGFPAFTKFVQDKFRSVPILESFQTIEQCSLEYDPEKGASIDPHVDDCWIWGERVVTLNLLSDSVLTMTRNEKYSRYNLDCVEKYAKVLNEEGTINKDTGSYELRTDLNGSNVVRIPMPRRSLLVMFNSARYDWEHQILREDITSRRICLAYREFTPDYLENGAKHIEGKPILEKAVEFFNVT